MEVQYQSTRNPKERVSASQAILQGLAPDGGLYVPVTMPRLDKTMEELSFMDYRQVAYEVMKLFLTDYTEEELKECIKLAYTTPDLCEAAKFDHEDMVRLMEADGAYYLELFHGPTIAFKDMALSILPYLLTMAAKKNNRSEEIVILTATSGDTGKAALAGFADVPGTKIIVFYPKDGVSKIQELQMLTQGGKNTHVVGIRGNFDDAQNEVKKLFYNKELRELLKEHHFCFSSANSINIGRLIPQIVYYVYAYTRLLGDSINFAVPTGNFGNILAAHYARRIGVPIHKLICASNENKVLYDFFRTGCYDKNREFILTKSPSMDILISSNLERLVFEIAGAGTKELMEELQAFGTYELELSMWKSLRDFYGGFAAEEKMTEAIRSLYEKTGYVMDTHTAVASAVYQAYKQETGDETKTVIVSTASPFKFAQSVMHAIGQKYDGMEDFELIDGLAGISDTAIPKAIEEIRNAPILHHTVCDKEKMQEAVCSFLGL